MNSDASSKKPRDRSEIGNFWKTSKIAIVAIVENGKFGDETKGLRYNQNLMIGR